MAKQTSIDAYREIKESGLLSNKRLAAYEAIVKHGPCTSGELARVINSKHPIPQLRPRLTELREMGAIEEAEERICKVSGKRCIVWKATGCLPTKIKSKQGKTKELKAACRRLIDAYVDNESMLLYLAVEEIKRLV